MSEKRGAIGRAPFWGALLALAALVLALLAGVFLPVYTDEIGWRFQERAGFDGVDKMYSEVCGLATLASPPWFMWPARWYSALFNGLFPEPIWLRLSGVFYALAWLGLALLLLRRLTRNRENRAFIAMIGPGLLALGTLPLVLVWSRPEQPIMLAAAGALLIAFADRATMPRPETTTRAAWLRSLGIVALFALAVSYHVKGVFLFPLIAGCLLFASRGKHAHVPRIVAAGLTVATTVSALSYWRARFDCPENEVLATSYARQNLSAELFQIGSLQDGLNLLGALLNNVRLLEYVANIGPQDDPLSHWLQHNQIETQASFYWFLALAAAWSLALLLALIVIVWRGWTDLRARHLDPRIALAVLCLVIAAGWSATQNVRNVYEAKFVLPLLVLAIMLALSAGVPKWLEAARNLIAAGIALFAVVSPIGIAMIYAPSLAAATQQGGYVEKQPFSVSVFNYGREKQQIEAAARLCGIDTGPASRAVMFDDATYPALIHTRLPQHYLGVIGGWNGKIADPLDYLQSRQSSGALISCRLFEEYLPIDARRVGNYCCLAPQDLSSLSKPASRSP